MTTRWATWLVAGMALVLCAPRANSAQSCEGVALRAADVNSIEIVAENEVSVELKVPVELDAQATSELLRPPTGDEIYASLWNSTRRVGLYKELLWAITAQPLSASGLLDPLLAAQPGALSATIEDLTPALADAINALRTDDWDSGGRWEQKSFRKAANSLRTDSQRSSVRTELATAAQALPSKVDPRTVAITLLDALTVDWLTLRLGAIEADLRDVGVVQDPAFQRALASMRDDLRVGAEDWRTFVLTADESFAGPLPGAALLDGALANAGHAWALGAITGRTPRPIKDPEWQFQAGILAATLAAPLDEAGSEFAPQANHAYRERMIGTIDQRWQAIAELYLPGRDSEAWRQALDCGPGTEDQPNALIAAVKSVSSQPGPAPDPPKVEADGEVVRVSGAMLEVRGADPSKLRQGARVLVVDSGGNEIAEGIVSARVGDLLVIELLQIRGRATPAVGQLIRVAN